MTDFKALCADLKALYAKHFKPSPKQKTFGDIVDGLLDAIEDLERSQAAVNSSRDSLMELSKNVNDGPIMAKIREYTKPPEVPKEEPLDKRCYDGNEDYDNMFG